MPGYEPRDVCWCGSELPPNECKEHPDAGDDGLTTAEGMWHSHTAPGRVVSADEHRGFVAGVAAERERIAAANNKPVERTPETVLRSMLAEREKAVVAAETAIYRPGNPSLAMQAAWVRAKDDYENMRATLATYLADGELLPYLALHTDYEARMRGDAPPEV